MNNQIFRKKNVDRVSSPEQLNDYVRVSNPGVWLALAAIVLVLAGVCVWGVFGRLDTTISVTAVSRDGVITCYVKEEDISSVQETMTITIDNQEFPIRSISSAPISVSEELDPYVMYRDRLSEGDWVYLLLADGGLSDGTYDASIVVESVSPISFVLN